MEDYYEEYSNRAQVAAEVQAANIEDDYYYAGMKEGAKRELFDTEAKTLRLLLAAREEFVEPLMKLAEEHAELGMLATSLFFLDEFIEFRVEMFENLHPKR